MNPNRSSLDPINSKTPPVNDKEWIDVSITRETDRKDKRQVYKAVFVTRHQVEWSVKHRFKIYRRLYRALTELGVEVARPFPPTYYRSKFGIGLSEHLLNDRAYKLAEWVKELIAMYADLGSGPRKLLSLMFDNPTADNDNSNLLKVFSYLNYMSIAYQRSHHARENSVDLFDRFRTDLERVRSATLPNSTVPVVEVADGKADDGDTGGGSVSECGGNSAIRFSSSMGTTIFTLEDGRQTIV